MESTILATKRFFTIAETRETLSQAGIEVTSRTIYNWAEGGRLERAKVGGGVWITRDSILFVIGMSTVP